MVKEVIDIGKLFYQNAGNLAVRNSISSLLVNGFYTELNSIKMRFGLKAFSNLASGGINVSGVYWSSVLNKLIAVSNGKVYTINENGVKTQIGSGLHPFKRVSFVSDNYRTLMANSGAVHYTDGLTVTPITSYSFTADYLAYMDEYVLAGKSSDKIILRSDPANSLEWNALNYFSPAARGGKNRGMISAWNELILPGTEFTEVYYNDGQTPFDPLNGSSINMGSSSADTLILTANRIFWLTDRAKFIYLRGKSPQIISLPVQNAFDSMKSLTDAVAFPIEFNGYHFILLNFPTDNVTYVYDIVSKIWYVWGHWNEVTGTYDAMRINSYTYSPAWNRHFVGDTVSDNVYELSGNKDLLRNIRFSMITGNVAHKTSGNKRSDYITMKVRRGLGTTGSEEKMMMRWNDNGTLKWCNWREVSLGKAGDRDHFVTKRGNGIYSSRQYEIIYSGSSEFEVMDKIEEGVTYLK